MPIAKVFKNNPEAAMRVIAVSCPLVSMCIRILSDGAIGPDAVIFDSALATAIILLSPWGEDRAAPLIAIALSVSVAGGVIAFLSDRLPGRLCVISYSLAVALPLILRFSIKVFKMLNDKEFLIGQASGWELAATFLNVGLAVIVLCIILISFCLVATESARIWLIVSAAVSVAMFIFLLVRSFTRRSVILGSISDSAFRRRLKLSLSFLPPEVPILYRRLYKSMCLMLEEDKKFLLGSYTLDEMARDLCTNRAYLSRMVNKCTGMHFNQMINGYRVRYSVELFRKDPLLKVSELAAMSGFKNKVTYSMAFKQFMNTTPGDWCGQYLVSVGKDPKKIISSRKKARGL